MTLISLFAVVLALTATGTAAVVLWHGRRPLTRVNRMGSRLNVLGGLRERAALFVLRRPVQRRGFTGAGAAGWIASPDLQPAQAPEFSPPTRTLVEDGTLGLAVATHAAGPAGHPPQDAYYVQRNVIAIARGLNALGEGGVGRRSDAERGAGFTAGQDA